MWPRHELTHEKDATAGEVRRPAARQLCRCEYDQRVSSQIKVTPPLQKHNVAIPRSEVALLLVAEFRKMSLMGRNRSLS